MSFSYTKVVPPSPQPRMYGYQKVQPNEMSSILERLQKPTYIQSLYNKEKYRPSPGPARRPSTACPKAPPGDSGVNSRRLSDKEIEKIVRRLRTPTISKLASSGRLDPAYEARLRSETPIRIGKDVPHPKTSAEYRKFITRITRPTTASKSKHFCVFCDDPAMECYLDLDFSDELAVSEEEISHIVDRIKTPTVASLKGKPTCKKTPPQKCLTISQREQLPLVSGMPRSRGVDEIVQRLYSSTHTIHVHKPRLPMATPVTVVTNG